MNLSKICFSYCDWGILPSIALRRSLTVVRSASADVIVDIVRDFCLKKTVLPVWKLLVTLLHIL